jgi:hypothetical protein
MPSNIPNLPTRASVYGHAPQAPPLGQHAFSLDGLTVTHRDPSGIWHDHEPVRKPADFYEHMRAVNTPESHALVKALRTGHNWRVDPEHFSQFAKYDPAHLAELVGANAGDRIHFTHTGGGYFRVTKTSRDGSVVNWKLPPNPEARKEASLDYIKGPDGRTPGWGSKTMLRMVQAARRMGLERLTMHHAAGNSQTAAFNGYYTWPRLGWNGTVPEVTRTFPGSWGKGLPDHLHHIESFHELFDHPDGPEAWKRHGTDAFDLHFDPRPGSPHVQRLVRYLRRELVKRKMKGRANG